MLPKPDNRPAIKKAMKKKMAERQTGKAPPGLRPAEGNKRCANCRHFRTNGNRCRLYGEYRVSADQVSDSWEPRNQ